MTLQYNLMPLGCISIVFVVQTTRVSQMKTVKIVLNLIY
jgi:hypothetical protein